MNRITVTLAPEATRVRVLATSPAGELLRAVLGPATATHPRAAATLLEGLALWYQQPLSVVLCADGRRPPPRGSPPPTAAGIGRGASSSSGPSGS
ncbi:MAG: hypothetical protein JW751_01245, partial [Polyangiaceae bacterium]|nr:hypothetical protein [Polyangiaceae bacterium]